MTLKVIDINDNAIKVSDETGILLKSPGFALADGKTVVLGEEAEKQARLKPTCAFNKYWQELSLDPLQQHDTFRHHADIAHAHLLHVAEQANIDHEVIVAVPGSFSRQQLAILLGLARHSPLRPIGMVDSALAAAVAAASADTVIYADIQLHQVVLTRLVQKSGRLRVDSVTQIPGMGSQNFRERIMKLVGSLFIQQCRFDPQHDAQSEQQLYNVLPQWLAQDEKEGNLLLELQSGGSVYTAKLPRQSLVGNLHAQYQTLDQHLAAMAGKGPTQLLLSLELAALPGLQSSLAHYRDLLIVDFHQGHRACLDLADHIVSGEEAIHLVTSLPLSRESKTSPVLAPPSHALFHDQAYALPGLEIRNQEAVNGHQGATEGLVLSITGLPDTLGRIEQDKDGPYFQANTDMFYINDEEHRGRHKLALGDRLHFPGSDETIRLIRVRDE